MITAIVCRYKACEGDHWERGIAICTAPGDGDVITIVPNWVRRPRDIPTKIWSYELLWAEGTMQLPKRSKQRKGA